MTAIPIPHIEQSPIPMNDLSLQHARLRAELDGAIREVVEGCSFILGPQVERFERAFADYCQVKHCVGVSSGTDALRLALQGCGVGEGDEVITTPLTFGATVEAIFQVGARPVFVDVDPDFFTLDPQRIDDALTARTRAIIPVHLYGQPADMGPLVEWGKRRDIAIIEDAAQAHGARYDDQPVGGLGRVACFSFYPGKNLGAYGDAGGLTTDDDVLAERLRRLRNHGQAKGDKFNYIEVGGNHRMDGIQGAVLDVKLRYLDQWNAHRRALADRYRKALCEVSAVQLPEEAPYAQHVYHLYVVCVPDRSDLATDLRKQAIESGVQYPHPLHLTPAFASLGYGVGDFPHCERVCSQLLSLPMFPDMTFEQVDRVAEAITCHYA
jgi:dTDP-4-amino-4,6-dideoxygalactose transaminase